VYLAPDGTSTEYGSILVEINKRIKQDLALSGDLSSLYAMTQDKVSPEKSREAIVVQVIVTDLESTLESGLGPASISSPTLCSTIPACFCLSVLCLDCLLVRPCPTPL
jgi:hypothetical protein